MKPLTKGPNRNRGPAVIAVVLGALLLGAAVSLPWLLASRSGGQDTIGAAGRNRVSPTIPASPTTPANTSPSPTQRHNQDAHFPGFWDVTTLEEAREVQEAVDGGHQPWRLDPASVAKAFAEALAQWRIQVVDVSTDGSADEGWTASVILRPYIGEEGHEIPGPSHALRLIGLEGAEHPAWFVAGLESEDIVVDTPDPSDRVSSPMLVKGRGVAYEGTLHAQIKDDAGNILLRADSEDSILMAGAYEPAPFSGELRFGRPGAPAGILIVSADTGTGPTPAISIVRLQFAEA